MFSRLTAMISSISLFSCAFVHGDEQRLVLTDLGELRLHHPHQLSPADTTPAREMAENLITWTRDKTWVPVRVRVDDAHPLVQQLKSGARLMLTPIDGSLAVIWLSLEADRRVLLQDRQTGGLTVVSVPPGKSLDLRWLGL